MRIASMASFVHGRPWATLFNVDALPNTYVLDAQGVVRACHLQGDDLWSTVHRLVQETESSPPR
jgi:hypothetical protein